MLAVHMGKQTSTQRLHSIIYELAFLQSMLIVSRTGAANFQRQSTAWCGPRRLCSESRQLHEGALLVVYPPRTYTSSVCCPWLFSHFPAGSHARMLSTLAPQHTPTTPTHPSIHPPHPPVNPSIHPSIPPSEQVRRQGQPPRCHCTLGQLYGTSRGARSWGCNCRGRLLLWSKCSRVTTVVIPVRCRRKGSHHDGSFVASGP